VKAQPVTTSVSDYGAVGDGVTDDAGAFQAAINGGDFLDIRIPQSDSTYIFTSTLTWEGKFIRFFGEGKDKSVLTWTADVDGFNFGSSTPSGSTVFEKLGIRTTVAAGTRAAIRGVFGQDVQGSFTARDLEIRGEDIVNDYWGIGISTKNSDLPIFEDLRLFGKSGNLSSDFLLTEAAIKCEADVGSVIYKFDDIFAINYNRGLYIIGSTDPSVEGVTIDRCSFVFCNVGVQTDFSTAPGAYKSAQLVIRDTHIEFALKAVLLVDNSEIEISGCLFFASPFEDSSSDAVSLQGCVGGYITETIIRARPIQTTMDGIVLTDCDSIRIINNTIDAPGPAIVFSGTTTKCEELSNRQEGTGAYFVDNSSSTDNKGGVLLATDGYEWTPAGILDQWGITVDTTDANGDITVTFPRAFVSSPFNISLTNGDGAAGGEAATIIARAPTSMVVRFAGAATVLRSVEWRVLGV
jgi:hypothetical protein